MEKEKLIALLQSLPPKTMIRVACDEERNTIFNDIELNINSDNNEAILFGLSGSEQER